MTDLGTFWFDLAPVAGAPAAWLRPFESVIATIAQLSQGAALGAGAIGAKLERNDAASIRSVGFPVRFFHCAAGEYPLEWKAMPGWIAAVVPGQLR